MALSKYKKIWIIYLISLAFILPCLIYLFLYNEDMKNFFNSKTGILFLPIVFVLYFILVPFCLLLYGYFKWMQKKNQIFLSMNPKQQSKFRRNLIKISGSASLILMIIFAIAYFTDLSAEYLALVVCVPSLIFAIILLFKLKSIYPR